RRPCRSRSLLQLLGVVLRDVLVSHTLHLVHLVRQVVEPKSQVQPCAVLSAEGKGMPTCPRRPLASPQASSWPGTSDVASLAASWRRVRSSRRRPPSRLSTGCRAPWFATRSTR